MTTAEIKPVAGFLEWFEANQMEIDQIQELLQDRLSDNPAILADQLSRVEAWNARLTTLLAEANTFLDIAERAALLKRDESWTDLDRRIHLKAEVTRERQVRDIISGLCEAIKTRTMVAMNLRKQNSAERTDWHG